MSDPNPLALVASYQYQTGNWQAVANHPKGCYMRLDDNERGIRCIVTTTAQDDAACIIFSVKGCANITTYAPIASVDGINACIDDLYADAEPSDESFVLTGQSLEKMNDFARGYGLSKPDSIVMGKALVIAMVEHLTKEGLAQEASRIIRSDFSDIDKLTDTDITNQFFANHFKLIKKWFKRQATKEGKPSNNVIAYAANHVPLLNNNRFNSKDLKAVLVDGNIDNPHYEAIAQAATKTTAIAIAQNYKNFSAYWIPF